MNNRKAALKQTDSSRFEHDIETNNDPFDVRFFLRRSLSWLKLACVRLQEDVGRIPDELLQVSHSSGNSGAASNHGNGEHKTEMALSRTVAASAFDVPKQASLQ